MREKRNYPSRVAWRSRFGARFETEPASDSSKPSRFCTLAKLLDGIERSLPGIQIHDDERIGIGCGSFKQLFAGGRCLESDSREFRGLEELRLKKKIINQYNCVGHDWLPLARVLSALVIPSEARNPSVFRAKGEKGFFAQKRRSE
jgi:hypothetical protein